MDRIQAAGANFCSLTENIDTGTAAGHMMMQIVGSFVEFGPAHRFGHSDGQLLVPCVTNPKMPDL